MRKRLLLLAAGVLASALTIGAVACDDDEEDTGDGEPAATEPADTGDEPTEPADTGDEEPTEPADTGADETPAE